MLAATLVDQLVYSVAMNVLFFYSIAAVFRGGVRLTPRPSIDASAFPSLLAFEPIWAIRLKGLQLKVPTTLLRERLVPPHLKGPWELLVRFVWNVVLAAGLARWR